MLDAFRHDRRGAMAAAFALTLLPVIGITGAAVDYGRLNATRASLQASADAIALRTIDDGDLATVETQAAETIAQAFGGQVREVEVRARRLSGGRAASGYEVTVSADVPLRMISAVPGAPKTVRIAAVARGARGDAHRVAAAAPSCSSPTKPRTTTRSSSTASTPIARDSATASARRERAVT